MRSSHGRHRFLDPQALETVRRRRFRSRPSTARIFTLAEEPVEAEVEIHIFAQPEEFTSHDWAVYLLRRAAQIEHALLAQYLFAAYSLRLGIPVGDSSTDDWREGLAQIAKEEMGHLLIVQNLLRLIGGPLSFDREEFPTTSELYPFPFQLEKLTKDSLAKYVFVEMSARPLPPTIISEQKRQEIEERARRSAGVANGAFLNHVGTLYETLLFVFENKLQEGPNGDFRTDRNDWLADRLQFRRTNDQTTDPDGTLNFRGVKALAPKNKAEALIALQIVAQQGEAADEPQDEEESHFERFLAIYDQCPEAAEALTYPVVTNPNTRFTSGEEGNIPQGKVLLWAKLFNVRYRMLLSQLAHALAMPAVQQGTPTPRKDLIRWVYEDMTNEDSALRDLADHLMAMPITAGADLHAGPPFELPYSLDLPDQPAERWRLHLDLLSGSQAVVQKLKGMGETHALLDDLERRDQERRTQIATLQNSGF
jgi:hypothetical protein